MQQRVEHCVTVQCPQFPGCRSLSITWGMSQSWQTPSLRVHHTSACQCAQSERSLHWEKNRQVCGQGTEKWFLQCSAFVCHIWGTYYKGNRSRTGCVVWAGQKSPNVIWARVNYWIRPLVSAGSHCHNAYSSHKTSPLSLVMDITNVYLQHS